jgi:L,D-peptidoglycan transpeptidase YkuD (ErfK/YbiS/YcfS/YnhG family)
VTPPALVVRGRHLWAGALRLPCTVGRGGVSACKAEGDGATPAGRHRIIAMLYRPDRLRPPAPWARPIRRGEIWCDDAADTHYNTLIRAPGRASVEGLWRADRLYDLVLVTDWNWPDATPGRGSAIFVHRWRGPGAPTAGCVALAAANLRRLAILIRPGTLLRVVGQGGSD